MRAGSVFPALFVPGRLLEAGTDDAGRLSYDRYLVLASSRPGPRSPFLEQRHPCKRFEVGIACQQVSALLPCGGVDDRICGRELVIAMQAGRQQSNAGVEWHNEALLRAG
jgi:hypothetical protein